MNDHNLDDLIIHDIPPVKNTKSKSLLTIIALLIIVLIVAILLINTLFNSSDTDDIVVDESASFRSSELELVDPKKVDTKVKTPVIKKPTISPKKSTLPKKEVAAATKKPEVKKPELVKETTISPKKDTPVKKDPEPVVSPKAKKVEVKKPVEKAPVTKKPAEVKQTGDTQKYSIQVGSFSKKPSDRFLSIIKNSGFDYSIVDNTLAGTKKLLIGPYTGRKAVDEALVKVRDRISKSAFVVKN